MIGKTTAQYVSNIETAANLYAGLIEKLFTKELIKKYIDNEAPKMVAEAQHARSSSPQADRGRNWASIKQACVKVMKVYPTLKGMDEAQISDIWTDQIYQPVRVFIASSDLMKNDDKEIAAFSKHCVSEFGTGGGKIVWGEFEAAEALTVAKRVEDAAVEAAKLSKKFGKI